VDRLCFGLWKNAAHWSCLGSLRYDACLHQELPVFIMLCASGTILLVAFSLLFFCALSFVYFGFYINI
jgi:hypothetical protein